MEMIKISMEEYKELLYKARILNALKASGVENWEWYEDALSDFHLKDDE